MRSDGTFVSLSSSGGGPLMKMVIPPCGWRSAGDEIGYCNFLPKSPAGTCDLTAHGHDGFVRIKRNIMRRTAAEDKERARKGSKGLVVKGNGARLTQKKKKKK